MNEPSANEVTQLLIDWEEGDKTALDKLLPLVDEELRRLASRYMAARESRPYAPNLGPGQ